MRELSLAAYGVPPRPLHYVGRTAAASAGALPGPCEGVSQVTVSPRGMSGGRVRAATASTAIHAQETRELVDAALRGGELQAAACL